MRLCLKLLMKELFEGVAQFAELSLGSMQITAFYTFNSMSINVLKAKMSRKVIKLLLLLLL